MGKQRSEGVSTEWYVSTNRARPIRSYFPLAAVHTCLLRCLHVRIRFAPLATKLPQRRNMSRRAMRRHRRFATRGNLPLTARISLSFAVFAGSSAPQRLNQNGWLGGADPRTGVAKAAAPTPATKFRLEIDSTTTYHVNHRLLIANRPAQDQARSVRRARESTGPCAGCGRRAAPLMII